MLGKLIFSIAIILMFFKWMLFNSGSRKDDKRILTAAFIMLVLIMGSRAVESTNSVDVEAYYSTYETAIDDDSLLLFVNFNPSMEKGYLALTWLLAKIIRWPQFILFFEAAFCCGITLRFIYKYSEDVVLSILGFMSLGILGFYMTGFRQSMAISLCLLALEMAERKRLPAFVLLVLLASLLHQTAVVFLPVYFVMNIKVNKFLSLAEGGLLCLIGLGLPFIVNLGNIIFNRDFEMIYEGSKIGGYINIAFEIFIVFAMVYQMGGCTLTTGISDERGERTFAADSSFANHKFLYILILGIGLYTMRYQALILERVSFFYTPVVFVLLPGAIQNGFAKKDRMLLKMLLSVGMLFLITWRFGSMDFAPFWNSVQ